MQNYNLRKVSSGLGFYLLISNLLLFLVPIVMLVFSMSNGVDFSDSTVEMLASCVTSIISLFVIGGLYCTLSATPMHEVIPISKIKTSIFVPVIFLGLALAFLSNYIGSIFVASLSVFGIESDISMEYTSNSVMDNFLYILGVAVIPALAEEFAFRGILLNKLKKYGNNLAVLVSALLFGLMHGNIIQIPFAFIIGLAFGFIVIKTSSILPTIIIHFLNNLISVVISIIEQNYILSDYVLNIIYIIFVFCLMIAGIISAYILSKKKDFFVIENNGVCSFKESLRICLTSTGMVLFLILILLETVFYTVQF